MTKSDLEEVIHMDRLQKPIILQISTGVIKENGAVITDLLRCHPEIRLKAIDPRYAFGDNIELEHSVNLNWHGRYMIDRSAIVPVSLWPLVFENVNTSNRCKDKEDKSSVIYEFLKGPAFAGRNDSVTGKFRF